MAALVQLLASGVNGAENGTATFVLRGTASSAASVLYNDFEQTAQPGTNIIALDAHGAAEVYTNAYVDITLKTSGGATLRTVTFGNTATTTEVISDSFTGTDYSGSPSGVNEPITLAAVLDKWDNSAGADDWKVAVNGVATNLSSAFSALAGLFFNVKDPTYGAAGDGTTDDTTSIGLAISAAVAAGGGIVFFPASTSFYKYTTLTLASGNVTLMGSGPTASTLKSASTSANITVSSTGKTRISGLSIVCTGANANPVLQMNAGANLTVEECSIEGTAITGSLVRKTSGSTATFCHFDKCTFTIGSSGLKVLDNSADDGSVSFNVTRSKLVLPSGYVGYGFYGPDFIATGCTVDGSAVTASFAAHVYPSSNSTAGKYLGQFTNNKFIDGGSTSVCFLLTSIATDSDFVENNNRFVGFTASTSPATADGIYSVSHNSQDAYRIWLGSRQGRTIEVTYNSTGNLTTNLFSSYQNVFINYTGAGNLTLKAPISILTNGAECNLVLLNNSGSQRDIVVDYGETPQTYGPQAATSGSDLTLQPGDQERVIVLYKAMHFGSGAPLVFAPVPVED